MGLSWLDGSYGGEAAGCLGADPCFAVGEVSAVVDGSRLAGEGSAEFIGVVGVDLFEPALDGTGRTPLGREPEAWRGYRGQRGYITVLRADDAEFYEKYAAELVHFANTLVGPSGAEDLLVDTIVTVFASAAWPSCRTNGPTSTGPW